MRQKQSRDSGYLKLKLNAIGKNQKIQKKKRQEDDRDRQKLACSMMRLSLEEFFTEQNFDQQSEKDFPNEYSYIENVEESQYTYNKKALIEKQLSLTLVIILLCGLLLVEIQDIEEMENAEISILIIMTLLHFSLSTMCIIRKLLSVQLQIDQKIRFHYQRHQPLFLSTSLRALKANKRQLFVFMIQLFLTMLHPNIFTKGKYFFIHDEFYHLDLKYSINDLLGVLMIIKYFMFVRSLVDLTKFATPRVKRVCNLNQIEYNFMYSIKCIRKEYPLRFIGITLCLVLIIFSFALRYSEGTVGSYNPIGATGFQRLPDCIWFTFITMYTVGYGQYVPRTIISRFLVSILSIIGVGLNSLLLVSVIEYLNMNCQQEKSFTLINRMKHRKKMEKLSTQVISNIVKISPFMQHKISADSTHLLQLEATYPNIKQGIDKIKKYQLFIKNLLPTNDFNETLIYGFLKIKEDFDQICTKQRIIQMSLEKDCKDKPRYQRKSGDQLKIFFQNMTSQHQT